MALTPGTHQSKAQLTLHELVDQDVICIGSDNFYMAEGFGCQTTRDETELPERDRRRHHEDAEAGDGEGLHRGAQTGRHHSGHQGEDRS